MVERSCEDKLEGAMVKHLCLENYQAAANAALKFPPLRRELVKAVTTSFKEELEGSLYSLFEFLSMHKSIACTSKCPSKIKMASSWRTLCSYLLPVNEMTSERN